MKIEAYSAGTPVIGARIGVLLNVFQTGKGTMI